MSTTADRRNEPAVYVVLLNWNNSDETLRCIESLRRSVYANLHIVIVDNGSRSDEYRKLLGTPPSGCHLISNPRNMGFAEGNNVGVRFAINRGADFVLVLNNDAVVHPQAVRRLVESALADEQIAIVAPVITLAGRGRVVFPRLVHEWSPLWYFLIGTLAGAELLPSKAAGLTRRLGTVDGCCFLIRRTTIPTTGLFDPVFFFGGYESPDLCAHLLANGLKVVARSDALVWAKRGDRRRSALTYSYWNPRNRILFARKHLNLPLFFAFLFLMPLHILGWTVAWGLLGARDMRVLARVAVGIWHGLRQPLDVNVPKTTLP